MRIENKLPHKNYNVSSESDGQLFLRYIWFFLFVIVLLYLFFISLSYVVVAFISIEDEKRFFRPLWGVFELLELPELLAERYSGNDYTVSLVDMDGMENAFADLWGQVYISQELIDNIDYLEELDFIIGHEFAHIENRDVLKWLVSDMPLTILLSLFWWEYGNQLFSTLLTNNYSKFWETRADRFALDFTYDINGHVWCALDFFSKKNTLWDNILKVFSTHPMTDARISRALRYAEKMWYLEWECTPISL